ncbi:prepilin peptidase [Alicyclobacillus ferrooxydans]|uniref:Prepilin type IV endopeptidase peptidase domain-containing protein n=1 Tax=Alicyclobacillus ferrooxydans TaxID=471514 RepID=A0A0P9D8J6_9BACL|nr:A24 family peptidase [Alicyclobacillus ferrooxydans]KPV45652.1 hypothetical protein AN477_01690 [Alicyclobacillus ferrooxydans]
MGTAFLHLFPANAWHWHGYAELMIWIGLVVYTAIAAWIDFRERRIPNKWTLLWLLLFFGVHVANQTLESSLVGFILVAVLMYIPTLLGLWGQGDWKMSMVLGAAIGALPALVIWFVGFLFVPFLKPWIYRASLRHLPEGQARSIPVAVPVFVATSAMFVVLLFFNRM